MPAVKRVRLDVLKPHIPNALEFAKTIAGIGTDYRVRLIVLEVDEKTETLEIEIAGADLDFDAIDETISELGGSLHSIDEVEVNGEQEADNVE